MRLGIAVAIALLGTAVLVGADSCAETGGQSAQTAKSASGATNGGGETCDEGEVFDASGNCVTLTEEEPPPVADPSADYTSNCAYVLGDFTSRTRSGFRFVGDADLQNTGNIGVVVRVIGSWKQAGTSPVRVRKTTKLKVSQHKRVGLTYLASQDEIDLIQAVGFDTKDCSVKATIVRTFGQPQ